MEQNGTLSRRTSDFAHQVPLCSGATPEHHPISEMKKPVTVAGAAFEILAMMSLCRRFARRVKLGEIAVGRFLQNATRLQAGRSGHRIAAPKNQFCERRQIDRTFQDLMRKYSSSVFQKYMAYSRVSRLRREGRFAIVTSVGRGMRWTLSPQLTSEAEADGEGVWS